MGTLTLEQHSDNEYADALAAIAARLRQCADDLVRRGTADADGKGGHVRGAAYVLSTVTSCVANLPLARLVQLAHAADRPVMSPAVLLDRAAGGVCAAMDGPPASDADQQALVYAEAALRGAGIIR